MDPKKRAHYDKYGTLDEDIETDFSDMMQGKGFEEFLFEMMNNVSLILTKMDSMFNFMFQPGGRKGKSKKGNGFKFNFNNNQFGMPKK